MLLLLGGGYKLLALQSETVGLIGKSSLLIKEQYNTLIPLLSEPEQKRFAAAMSPSFSELLGKYKTTCRAAPKYGFMPISFSIEGVSPVKEISVLYGNITEPCAEKNIIHTKGAIGKAEEVEIKNNNLERDFFILAIALGLLKGVDILYERRLNESHKRKKRKIR